MQGPRSALKRRTALPPWGLGFGAKQIRKKIGAYLMIHTFPLILNFIKRML
jgi:hypothetical protein